MRVLLLIACFVLVVSKNLTDGDEHQRFLQLEAQDHIKEREIAKQAFWRVTPTCTWRQPFVLETGFSPEDSVVRGIGSSEKVRQVERESTVLGITRIAHLPSGLLTLTTI